MKESTTLQEKEYSILITDSDFAINQIKKNTEDLQNEKFYSIASKAISTHRNNNHIKSKKEWKKIIEGDNFNEIQKLIANIKILSITKQNKNKVKEYFKKINDPLALMIYQINSKESENNVELFHILSNEFKKLKFYDLASYCNAFYLGKKKYESNEKRNESNLKAAELFRDINAIDCYNQALAMNEVSTVKQATPEKAIQLIKNAAQFAKKGNAPELYNYCKGNYYQRLANKEGKNKKASELYKLSSNYYSKIDDKSDYHTVMADHYFTLGLITTKKTEKMKHVENAVKHAKKTGNKIKTQSMQGVYYLEKATSDPQLTDAPKFLKLSYQMFKKAGKTQSYFHTKAMYYLVKHAFVSDVKKKIQCLENASKNYQLSGDTKRHHYTKGLSLSWSIKLENKFMKEIQIYELAANEFEKANNFEYFHLAKGRYYFFKALITEGPKSVDLWIKSAEHFRKVNNPLEFEAIGKASFLIALHTKSLESISNAIEFYKKTDNTGMLDGCYLVQNEIKAMNEPNEEKQRQYYLKAAEYLQKFSENTKNTPELKGLPKKFNEPNLEIFFNATYEHYKGLGTTGVEKEMHFKNANNIFQKMIILEKENKVIMKKYAKFLQDWKKFDKTHEILKKLSSKFIDDESLKKEFTLNENLLLRDYKNLKNDFIVKENQINQFKEMISEAMKNSDVISQENESFYDMILQKLIEIGLELESKSPTYKKLSEEELRDIFHSHLNIILKGRVTSESFRKRGHTDLHISNPQNYQDVIILEFKLWDVPSYYQKGINQLLSYSTKRDEKSILITLNKKPSWDKVVERAKKAVTSHLEYISNSFNDLTLQNIKTAFTTEHNSQGRIEPLKITHLLFDLSD